MDGVEIGDPIGLPHQPTTGTSGLGPTLGDAIPDPRGLIVYTDSDLLSALYRRLHAEQSREPMEEEESALLDAGGRSRSDDALALKLSEVFVSGQGRRFLQTDAFLRALRVQNKHRLVPPGAPVHLRGFLVRGSVRGGLRFGLGNGHAGPSVRIVSRFPHLISWYQPLVQQPMFVIGFVANLHVPTVAAAAVLL